MSLELGALIAYVLAQLGIGLWASRRIRTEDDYLVAGRRMGPLLAGGTIFATWFGAETCMGGAGEAYAGGVSLATAEPFGYGLCIVFMGLVFAVRLWKLRLTTLADFFRRRYSPGVERLAALVMIPTSLLWAAAQVRAFGHVLSSAADLSPTASILLAAGAVILYTGVGGLLADAVTDVVQGVCLVVGLGVILVGTVHAAGGWGDAVAAIDPGHLRLVPADTSIWSVLEAWSVPILGSVVAQELVVRVSAARSAEVARGSALVGGLLYVLVGLVPVFVGLVAAGLGGELVAGIDHPEQVLPEVARHTLGPLLHALFAGALVSAVLSTADSTLLVCSSLLSHNLVQPLFPDLGERAKVRLARGGVLLFGLVATALALSAESVAALVEEASSLGSAGLFVLLALGLFTRRGGAASGHGALVGGLVVYVLAGLLEWPLPFLSSLAAALVAFVLLSARASRPAR
jgi:SSS family solute:Na+ symporter